jgi:hypothetical protein
MTTTKSNQDKKQITKNTNKKKKAMKKAAIHLVGDEPIVNPSFLSINSCRLMLADAACLSSCSQVLKKSKKVFFNIGTKLRYLSPSSPQRSLIRSLLLTAQGFQLIDG